MKRLTIVLCLLCCLTAMGQHAVRIACPEAQNYAAQQLDKMLRIGGCNTTTGRAPQTIYVLPEGAKLCRHLIPLADSLREDGYLIVGDGRNVWLYGKGEKGTLYAVYAFLEQLGYRLYTPDALHVPDMRKPHFPKCRIVSNPAFAYREVSYYYPVQSQLYADWHHLHTSHDREAQWGMYVHTFSKLLPPSHYYDKHPEWYSLNGGRRSRDGQLCLSNPEVLEALCQRLADTMASQPQKMIWSVSPNDNYNACECANCKQMDSIYGGPSGTLINFVNRVARRFPTKTIATLAYQYTRQAPTSSIRPDEDVLVMLCPIEAGREQPIATSPSEASFRKDMDDWHRLTRQLYVWDYVVQFRNFWTPFPNLHVLQPNLQYFQRHGATMMFEQATGDDNVSSWMDLRCYMIAKLLWNPDADIDSIMTDFYEGYYGEAAPYVQAIVDTMTSSLIASGQRLDIYGYPIDGDFVSPDGHEGYLWGSRLKEYENLMRQAYASTRSGIIHDRLRFFELSLDFATIEHLASGVVCDNKEELQWMVQRLVGDLERFGVRQMMEMGISPDEYGQMLTHWIDKSFGINIAKDKPSDTPSGPTPPYLRGTLTDGEVGILDYRHRWLGWWGETLEATVDLEAVQPLHLIQLDFYFYPLSWIFLPQSVAFYISDDGLSWQLIDHQQPVNPQQLATPSLATLQCHPAAGTAARYVRIVATPLKEIPSWHRAAGQKPWIFTDEIIIR